MLTVGETKRGVYGEISYGDRLPSINTGLNEVEDVASTGDRDTGVAIASVLGEVGWVVA